jgi:hypothetical protein
MMMVSYVDIETVAMSPEEVWISKPLEKVRERGLDRRCIRVSPIQFLSLI